MAISRETKLAINDEIEKLQARRKQIVAKIKELRDRLDSLTTQRDAINIQITNLETDLNG